MREVSLSFAVEIECHVSTVFYFDATFQHAGPEQIGETWCLADAVCKAVQTYAGCVHRCLCNDDYTDWLRDWVNTQKNPVVLFRKDWERLSQSLPWNELLSLQMRNRELWEIVNDIAATQRVEDREAATDSDTDRQIDLQREMYASPVYGLNPKGGH